MVMQIKLVVVAELLSCKTGFKYKKKNAFVSITDTGKTFMRWKITILYLTCTWLNRTLLQKLAPSLRALCKEDHMALWEGLTRGLPAPTPPPPTPYTTQTRGQDRMNASRSASMRHSGPGLGLNLEPVVLNQFCCSLRTSRSWSRYSGFLSPEIANAVKRVEKAYLCPATRWWVTEWVLVENLVEGKREPAMVHIPVGLFVILFKTLPLCDSHYMRVSMGWWLLRLSAKSLALLRLSVNFFQLCLTKKLKINFFCSGAHPVLVQRVKY